MSTKQYIQAEVTDFIGCGLKEYSLAKYSLEDIDLKDTNFSLIKKEDITDYRNLYLNYVYRKKLKFPDRNGSWEDYFDEALKSKTVEIYGLKDESGKLIAACTIDFMRLSKEINKAYFGFNSRNFVYLRRFCCEEGEAKALGKILFTKIAKNLKKQDINFIIVHIARSHREAILDFIQNVGLKRKKGSNFFSEEDLLIISF